MKYRGRSATGGVRKKKKKNEVQRSSIAIEKLKTQQNKVSHKPSKAVAAPGIFFSGCSLQNLNITSQKKKKKNMNFAV
jgi:hypothetical protein